MNLTKWKFRGVLAALTAFSLSLPPASLVSAQNTPQGGTVFFVGRSDNNGDGFVDPNDTLTLYSGQPGQDAVVLSTPDANVAQFSISADGAQIAYTAQRGGGYVLDMGTDAAPAPVQVDLTGMVSPVSVDAFNDAVWVVGLNADQIPVLRGFAPGNGGVLGEHVFRRPNTSVVVHASGQYVLAYNAETGGLSVLRLPSMELVQFPLTGYAATAPVWSPTTPRFVMGISADANFSNAEVDLIDVSTGVTTTLYQPDFTSPDPVQLGWSSGGHFVVVSRPADATGGRGLSLINVDTGADSRLQQPNIDISIAGWSPDDSYLLLSEQPADGSQPLLVLYATATNSATSIQSLNDFNVASIAWRDDQPLLAALGQSRQSGQFSLIVIEPVSGAAVSLFDGIDTTLLTSPLRWSGDGEHVYFVANSNDSVITSLGTPTALFAAESSGSGVVERLSPENVVVDTLVLQTR